MKDQYKSPESKKNWTCEGMTTPRHYIKKEDLLTQAQKTLEPLAHPYTATPSPCETGPVLRPVLWHGIDEGIFLTPA